MFALNGFVTGCQVSPQDRFLIMAAEMDSVGSQELAQFWKEVPKTKIMEHRYTPAFLNYNMYILIFCPVHRFGSFYCDIPQIALSCPG